MNAQSFLELLRFQSYVKYDPLRIETETFVISVNVTYPHES